MAIAPDDVSSLIVCTLFCALCLFCFVNSPRVHLPDVMGFASCPESVPASSFRASAVETGSGAPASPAPCETLRTRLRRVYERSNFAAAELEDLEFCVGRPRGFSLTRFLTDADGDPKLQ